MATFSATRERRPAPAPGRDTTLLRRNIGRLLITCPDRPGIVAAVTSFLYDRGANILELQQYSTGDGTFFQRIEFALDGLADRLPELEHDFGEAAAVFGMRWSVSPAARVKRVAVLVSKADHALRELLWRRHAGDLDADIRMVISNHPDLVDEAARWGVPYHHVPVPADGKAAAEDRQLDLLRGNVDLVVLARYMQILSERFVSAFPNRIINIHHSFLPAFPGANPYEAAAERGVKLIGATAHYVTADLDAGPIIEQELHRVDHRHTAADLRRIGRYVERTALARAVAWHLEDRVIVHGNKTIVFA